MKQNQFEVLPIPIHKLKEQPKSQPTTTPSPQNTIRISACISSELAEKLKDYVYWRRTTQQEVVIQALEALIKDKPIESRPESVKNRKKAGRKRKA